MSLTFRRQHSLATKRMILMALFYQTILQTLKALRESQRTIH